MGSVVAGIGILLAVIVLVFVLKNIDWPATRSARSIATKSGRGNPVLIAAIVLVAPATLLLGIRHFVGSKSEPLKPSVATAPRVTPTPLLPPPVHPLTRRGIPIRMVDFDSKPFGVNLGESVGIIVPFDTTACIYVLEKGEKIAGNKDKYIRDSILTTEGMLYYFETSSDKPIVLEVDKAVRIKKT